MTAPAISTLPDGMGQQVLVVEPYDVERGDRLAGLRTPVDSLLYDGNVGMWLYVDARGVIIARRLRLRRPRMAPRPHDFEEFAAVLYGNDLVQGAALPTAVVEQLALAIDDGIAYVAGLATPPDNVNPTTGEIDQ